MKKFTLAVLIIFAALALVSCSAETNAMEKIDTAESKNLAATSSYTSSSVSISIATVSCGSIAPEAAKEKVNGQYLLTCSVPEVKTADGVTLSYEWYVNGLQYAAEADGSLSALFQNPGYRNVTCIVRGVFSNGATATDSATASVVAYPIA